MGGKLVRILADEYMDAGEYTLDWDGANSGGSHLNAGVYLCLSEAQIDGQIFRQTREMILSQ